MKKILLPCLVALLGCGSGSSYVRTDTTLGRVVIYRNGVAYFERYARVPDDTLHLSVPADKVDDFLKSLTVVDAQTGKPAPIAYPTAGQSVEGTGLIDMNISLQGSAPHDLKLSYVTEAPSWKPSYRVVLGKQGKVSVQAWAIVDNTSGEDWQNVKLGVGSSSALSFRFDLRSVRVVQRETLRSDDLFAVAPPMGGSTHGRDQDGIADKKLVVELTDESLEMAKNEDAERGPAPVVTSDSKPSPPSRAASSPFGRGRNAAPAAKPKTDPNAAPGKSGMGGVVGAYPQQQAGQPGQQNIGTMAQSLRNSRNQIVVEGYADKGDGDKFAASLDRANRVREQLIRNGVPPEQVVAVGNGEQAGRRGGVRIVEAPPPSIPPSVVTKAGESREQQETAAALSAEPIGTSHFESTTPMTVPRGTSAMVSIMQTETDGEVVFFYDPESTRGNTAFPFRAVRIKNPTDSVLESGPVTVFGEGRFIGEGLSEPIPARSVAFVPFALDRQIAVDKDETDRDEIARILTVQRGVFSTEVQHTHRTTLTLNNRLDEKATVYIRHSVRPGYKLTKAPVGKERLGSAYLFRVEVEPNGKTEVSIEEATPLFKTTDIRSPGGMDLIKVYLSSAASDGPLKSAVSELLKLHTEIGNLEQQIGTMREQMQEYRMRMDELHAQIVTLKAVKTNGGNLMQHLEKKLQEVSEKLSKATVALVSVQEKLMVTRIRFQDGVADLSLERKPDAAAAAAGKG